MTMTMKRAWTTEEVHRLIQLREQGWATDLIAEEMQRTCWSIQLKLYRLGFRSGRTWRAWTIKEIRLAVQLRQEGHRDVEIAERLGRTRSSIMTQFSRQGVPFITERLRQYIRWLTGPHTVQEVADAMGVKRHAVWKVKKRLRDAGFEVVEATPEK